MPAAWMVEKLIVAIFVIDDVVHKGPAKLVAQVDVVLKAIWEGRVSFNCPLAGIAVLIVTVNV